MALNLRSCRDTISPSVVAGLVLSDFGFAEVADTTPTRDALRP